MNVSFLKTTDHKIIDSQGHFEGLESLCMMNSSVGLANVFSKITARSWKHSAGQAASMEREAVPMS